MKPESYFYLAVIVLWIIFAAFVKVNTKINMTWRFTHNHITEYGYSL